MRGLLIIIYFIIFVFLVVLKVHEQGGMYGCFTKRTVRSAPDVSDRSTYGGGSSGSSTSTDSLGIKDNSKYGDSSGGFEFKIKYKKSEIKQYKFFSWYMPRLYRTNVTVYDGDLYVTTYTDKGPDYKGEYSLITGATHTFEKKVE